MTTLRQTLKRNAYGIAAIMLTAAVTLPNLIVGQAYAAQMTSRSVQMQTAEPGATGNYTINFTAATTDDVQSVVVDFCNSTTGPLVGETCTAPTGFAITAPSVQGTPTGVTGTWTASAASTSRLQIDRSTAAETISASTAISFEVSGFTNPTSSSGETFYARILTYDNTTSAGSYSSTAPGTHVDDGGVALSTAELINVSASVLETLLFCTSKDAPGTACGSANTPALELGHGTPTALDATAIDTDTAYFQLSTNASNGVNVRLLSGNSSGGLESGSDVIPAIGAEGTMLAGTAAFGLQVTSSANVSATLDYDGTTDDYGFLTEAVDSGNGVDSTYGSLIAASTGPVDEEDVLLSFGATASNTTPAGIYTADLSLIATGTY